MPRLNPPARRAQARSPRWSVVTLAAIAVLTLGCRTETFDPSTPCVADGRAPGGYPALEALVPTAFRGRPPDSLDSGRNCSPRALGSLASHGVDELRFAGATWGLGADGGISLAILEADSLHTDWVAEFYEAGARAGRNIKSVETGSIRLPDGRTAFRLDTLNLESYQTVIVWPDGARVRVALVASSIRAVPTKEAHESVVVEALAAAFPGVGIATPTSRSRPG